MAYDFPSPATNGQQYTPAGGQTYTYVSADTKWTVTGTGLSGLSTASTTDVLTGTSSSAAVTPDALAALWEKGGAIASAASLVLPEGGYFFVTGIVAIFNIDFAVPKDGRMAWLVFGGALTINHSATLNLPGAASIVTAAGDRMLIVQDSGDTIYCLVYERAATKPAAANGDIAVNGSVGISGPNGVQVSNGISAFARNGGGVAAAPALQVQRSDAWGAFFQLLQFVIAGVEAGSVQTMSANTVSYVTSSDGRLKTARRPLDDSGEIIDALNPVYFHWIDADFEDFGFIAQEVAEVSPLTHTVSRGNDAVEGKNTDEDWRPWGMQHGRMEAVLVAELKAVRARLAALEAAAAPASRKK